MTAAQLLLLRPQIAGTETPARKGWAWRLCRALLFCSLFCIIFLPEFSRDNGQTLSPIYSKVAAGFRFIDLVLLLLVFGHVAALGCLRGKRLRFPRTVVAPGLGFLFCIAIAVYYGHRRGGSNFFFDWRALALGVGLYFVWSFWLQDGFDVAAGARVFLAYMGCRIVLLYLLYVCGQGDTLAGVSIPVFDGPVLSSIVFAALLAFESPKRTGTPGSKLLFTVLVVVSYLLVLLSLRRTYWGELAIGTLILLSLRQRHRLRGFVLAAVAVVVAAGVLGSSFSGRLLSLDVTRDDTQFSADNADHVHDLMDAWYEVHRSPIMGIGVGTTYPTWQIRNWKLDSVMVHNAPLHVWLKYGIAGLACYLWFHLALLKWLLRNSRSAASDNRVFLRAAFAYLTAQFVMTLGFAPWPYSELQLTTLMSFILAAAVAAENRPVRIAARSYIPVTSA